MVKTITIVKGSEAADKRKRSEIREDVVDEVA